MTNRCRTAWLFATLIFIAMLAACGGGGDDIPAMPFSTAAEVRAAFLNESESRRILPYVGEPVGPEPQSMADPSDIEFRGVTSAGVPVVLTLRFRYRLTPISKVSVGGILVPELQQISARIAGQDYLAPVLEIREYKAGWLLIYASLRAYQMNWWAERWVMYHPGTKQFIDCGEDGSIRPPEWGPAVSPVCVQR